MKRNSALIILLVMSYGAMTAPCFGQTSAMRPHETRADPDAANWNIDRLDTAKDADYLSPVEKDIILEMNKVRDNPKKFAALYIQPMLQNFDGNDYKLSEELMLVTEEGAAAVRECISVLNKTGRAQPFKPERGLYMTAREHAIDQSKTGQTGHSGSDGSVLTDRCAKYGKCGTIGETIHYGYDIGRQIVISLLINDGMPSREHQKMALSNKFNQAGASKMPHPMFNNVCVVVYGEGYVSR